MCPPGWTRQDVGNTGRCMGRRRHLPPFEMEVLTLGKGGTGVGVAPDGRQMVVRGAPPGSRVLVVPRGRRKGVWTGWRRALVRPPSGWVQPPCAVFGLCGGCTLQELALDVQREARAAWARTRIVPWCDSARIHPPRAGSPCWGYRNKVELSFGARRYLSEEDHAARSSIDGQFLGFHAPGRWDRVVDVERCWLISEAANALLGVLRTTALGAAPPYDPRRHEGFWRHATLREAQATGQLLVALGTTTIERVEAVEQVATALQHADLPDGAELTGVVWYHNPGKADVAAGEVHRIWGRGWIEEHLGSTRFRLSASSFFQSSTAGARVLYDTVAEALGEGGGALVDLYCGVGSIGLYLADRFDHLVGVEAEEAAVEDARANAELNEVSHARFRAARVEQLLEVLDGARAVVVDPPRAGVHPKVARALADCAAEVLVYVACNPASLGRDAEILVAGGWRLSDLWTVDLFPHTGHVEAVGRFVRGMHAAPAERSTP